MRQRIYLDTSVIGGYLDNEFQEWSKRLFEEFKSGEKMAVISDVTLTEIESARLQVRNLIKLIPVENIEFVLNEPEAEELASAYLKEGAITKKFYEDALHIAIATFNKVDVLVSWNFKHIVNLDRIKKHNAVNLKLGYMILEIRNPREILKYHDMKKDFDAVQLQRDIREKFHKEYEIDPELRGKRLASIRKKYALPVNSGRRQKKVSQATINKLADEINEGISEKFRAAKGLK